MREGTASPVGLILLVLGAIGCSRTGLDTSPPAPLDGAPDVPLDPIADPDADVAVEPEAEVPCPSSPESCDGLDNDCDGAIDEGLRPEHCATGGARYCVLGRWTACPTFCTVCNPGTIRICYDADPCTHWGRQTCNADGSGFTPCAETFGPSGCPAFQWDASCCVSRYCCQDHDDRDGDGDTNESIGLCDGVLCGT